MFKSPLSAAIAVLGAALLGVVIVLVVGDNVLRLLAFLNLSRGA